MKTIYICEGCGGNFDDEAAALRCESTDPDPPKVEVGNIVLLGAGFGWFDGDKDWISNPEVVANWNTDGLCTKYHTRRKKCPNGDTNCMDSCCTLEFYYVITAIDQEQHRTRYHVLTKAMSEDMGSYRSYYTYGEYIGDVVENPPVVVIEGSKDVIGKLGEQFA